MEYINFVKSNEKGVLKKINFQKKALDKYIKVNIMENKQNKYFYNDLFLAYYPIGNNFKSKVLRKIIEFKILKKLTNQMNSERDIVYLRYFSSSFYLLKFLKIMKLKNKKIVIEIPTYPYDQEIQNKNIFNILDKYYRQKLYKYVDKIVTYSDDKIIWNIPCINISNGIDLEEICLVNKSCFEKNKIVFTSVSNCSFWHGIDRFLYSLESYSKLKKKKEIIFNIVGDGIEVKKLKEIVSNSKFLSKIVKFQGFKIEKELDEIYNETDICVGSLARHRSGLYAMKALKNREYCAKGLPMVFSENDLDLRDVPFVYHATPDEELIDIEKLIKWYENINLKPKDIRKYAEEFSWDIQMKKVIDEIREI